MRKTVALNALRNGETGMVANLTLTGAVFRRLVEMGVTPGVTIKLIKRAPLGDPIEIALRGYRLTLRARDAGGIWVAREGRS